MKLIIDRIEGTYAVCEEANGKMKTLPLSRLPAGVREGDVLSSENGRWVIDSQAAQERRRQAEEKRRRLFGR